MKISSSAEQIFMEENLISYQLRYCYFTPIPITLAYEKTVASFYL